MPKLRRKLRSTAPVILGVFLAASAGAGAQAAPSCQLGNGVKHVVHLQFDNVHLRRDNPNVPSDIEQMPNLLNFLTKNGVVSGSHYTILISHTAGGLITGMTGLYPDRTGMPVTNSYRVWDSSGHPSSSHPAFVYWTAKDTTDGLPVLLTDGGKNAPAPWVAYTRAGCDFGAFSIANTVVETIPSDISTIFGAASTEYSTVLAQLASSDPKTRALPNANWLGVAVHCAKDSARCAAGAPDILPDEPGGYAGFNALYGAINVQPSISPSGPVKDIDGNVIADAQGNPGFPNIFNPTASQTLGYVATMLEAGVPVVYAYIAPTHDQRGISSDRTTRTFGPGETPYVEQNRLYDEAFGKFFARLEADGIDETNTLFVVTADENDHFIGGAPTPANCDGVTTPCNYFYPGTTTRSVGELVVTLDSTILSETGVAPAPFLVHADSAPTIYLDGNPAPTSPVTRKYEAQIASLTWVNSLPGKNSQVNRLEAFVADRAEMKLLHMLTLSPARNPSLTMFGHEDYFFQTSRGSLPLAPNGDCATVPTNCVAQTTSFAWNHGSVQEQIVRTFVAAAGPGVKRIGRNDSIFSDHTDIRPTLMTLLGLSDDYVHDGRVMVEAIDPRVLPRSLRDGRNDESEAYVKLARVYKQLASPIGALGKSSLSLATKAINGKESTYAAWLSMMERFTADRDALALQIRDTLDAAAFKGERLREQRAERLAERASRLIDGMRRMEERAR